MRIGPYECTTLETGLLHLAGGDMFQDGVPGIWQREFQLDEEKRISFAVRSLLLRAPGIIALVDAGCGTKLPPETESEFGVDQKSLNLSRALERAGIGPEAVTHLIFTHLHFDHAGGASVIDREGVVQPVFSNARHLVQRENLETAENPPDGERDAYLPEDLAGLRASGALEILDGPCRVLPRIELETARGHTAGQQYPIIRGDGRTLLFPGDVIPTAAHLRLPWLTAFDQQPRLAVREKRRLIERAARGGWLLVFDHEPRFAACTVREEGRAFEPDRIWEIL